MRIVQINGGVFGSTGRIMFGIAEIARESGHEVLCCSPVTSTNKDREPEFEYYKIGRYNTRRADVLCDTVTGLHGSFALIATRRLLRETERFSPDLIHLHTIHGGFVNLNMLFTYLKDKDIPVIWTLHDCWSFTGGCPHFEAQNCNKWMSGCRSCPLYREYPASIYDNSALMYRKKKTLFTGLKRLCLVTPSAWLKSMVEKSYLKNYPVKVIPNGIDLSLFRPTGSSFRKDHKIGDRVVLLGVAFGWSDKKGLDVFIRLARLLPDSYRIVLAGTDEAVDKLLPENIISIHRTRDAEELAQIYSAADLFVNPTREDTFPTVNIEALACGTPVLTFDTGGSPEIIDASCGMTVANNDFDDLAEKIKYICELKPYTQDACLKRAAVFDESKRLRSYTELYEELLSK